MATNEELSELLNNRTRSLLEGIKFTLEEIRHAEQRVDEAAKELALVMKLLLFHDPDSPLKNDETYLKILRGMRPISYASPRVSKTHEFEEQLLKIFPDEATRTFRIIDLLEGKGIKIPWRGQLGIILKRSPFFDKVERGVWTISEMGKEEIRKTEKEENDGHQ